MRLGERGPEFQLVALAAALVATVATLDHVYGEVAGTAGRGAVQGTISVPLIARPLGRLEAKQPKDFLHGDVAAKPVEIDSGHVVFLGGEGAC